MLPSAETVWLSFHPNLQRFVSARLPDSQAADDVLQEVYLKLHTHLPTLRDQDRLQAWLYQIARNAVTDYYRRHKREVDLPENGLPDPDAELTDDLSQKLINSVRATLDCLPADYREALVLTEYHGLTQLQLAEQTGLSLSGAKSRVQRARKMLKDALENCCHFHFDRRGNVIDYQPHCRCCAASNC